MPYSERIWRGFYLVQRTKLNFKFTEDFFLCFCTFFRAIDKIKHLKKLSFLQHFYYLIPYSE